MKQEIAEKKEQLKEQIANEIDRYYESLVSGLEGKSIDINGIERMLGETKKQMDELITEATGEAVTKSEPPTEKNNVQAAERI